MAVILEVLGLIITFTLAMEGLTRLGVDVGWLNPITFFRRRAWRQKTTTPAMYALEHPVDVVGLLAVAVVQATGAVTEEQKRGVRALLCEHLSLSAPDADSLWVASSHMLRNRSLALSELPAVLGPSADQFSDYHQQTLRTVLRSAAQISLPVSAAQQELLDAVEAYFTKRKAASSPWVP